MELVDAHTHMELFSFMSVPIERANSLGELLDMLKGSKEEVILGWGWSQEKLGAAPEREHLDSLDRPVLLLRIDAHVGVVNSALVDALGLKPGSNFDPSKGYLYEEELWRVASLLKPKGEKMKRALRKGLERAKAMGITEVHDFVDSEIAKLYLDMEDDLPVRVILMPYYESYEEVLEIVSSSESLKVGWVKVFVDGSIGARTAYLKEPYKDGGGRGRLLRSREELVSIINELESKGLRVAFHAIGDAAVEECLLAFERAKPKLPYHRIEHAELITRQQALRAKRLNLLLCVQPNFTPFFWNTYVEALGEKRARRTNPIGMLDEVGVDMVFGSDMMPFDPDFGLRYAGKILGRNKAIYYYGGWRGEGRYL